MRSCLKTEKQKGKEKKGKQSKEMVQPFHSFLCVFVCTQGERRGRRGAENAFFEPFLSGSKKTPSIYQDRLGTDTSYLRKCWRRDFFVCVGDVARGAAAARQAQLEPHSGRSRSSSGGGSSRENYRLAGLTERGCGGGGGGGRENYRVASRRRCWRVRQALLRQR